MIGPCNDETGFGEFARQPGHAFDPAARAMRHHHERKIPSDERRIAKGGCALEDLVVTGKSGLAAGFSRIPDRDGKVASALRRRHADLAHADLGGLAGNGERDGKDEGAKSLKKVHDDLAWLGGTCA